MKIIHFISLFLASVSLFGQEVNIIYKDSGDDIMVFAQNPHHCPVSVKLKFTLKNMKSDLGSKSEIFVVPALDDEYYLAKLSVKNKSRDANYQTDFETKYGDVTLQSHDVGFPYELPYARGTKLMIHQGYNGRYSHSGINALDFNMRKGSPIYAARGGIVIKVEDRNSKGCASPSCHRYNNMIVILHSDGSMAVYSHLQRDGSLVAVGDNVHIGEEIGRSGATGFASGPHLHFMVILARFGSNKSVKTKFNTLHNGITYLKEHESYTKPF